MEQVEINEVSVVHIDGGPTDCITEERERLIVQLAGCLSAADGWADDLPKEAYGWSPAFEAVRILRERHDTLLSIVIPECLAALYGAGECLGNIGNIGAAIATAEPWMPATVSPASTKGGQR